MILCSLYFYKISFIKSITFLSPFYIFYDIPVLISCLLHTVVYFFVVKIFLQRDIKNITLEWKGRGSSFMVFPIHNSRLNTWNSCQLCMTSDDLALYVNHHAIVRIAFVVWELNFLITFTMIHIFHNDSCSTIILLNWIFFSDDIKTKLQQSPVPCDVMQSA